MMSASQAAFLAIAIYLGYWLFWAGVALLAGMTRESRAIAWRRKATFNDDCYYIAMDGNRVPCRFLGWLDNFTNVAQVTTPLGTQVLSGQQLYPNVRKNAVQK